MAIPALPVPVLPLECVPRPFMFETFDPTLPVDQVIFPAVMFGMALATCLPTRTSGHQPVVTVFFVQLDSDFPVTVQTGFVR